MATIPKIILPKVKPGTQIFSYQFTMLQEILWLAAPGRHLSKFFRKCRETRKKCLHLVFYRQKSEAVVQRCSVRKGVLRNFEKFWGKYRCQNLLFNKVAGLRPATLLKRRLWNRCFPVHFSKFQRTTFLTEHLRWLFRV